MVDTPKDTEPAPLGQQESPEGEEVKKEGSALRAGAARRIIKHRCGHTVDYSRFPYWQSTSEAVPAAWRKQECTACEDAHHIPIRCSVVAKRRESGEWAGDR